MVEVVKIEPSEFCRITQDQAERITNEINDHVRRINDWLGKGRGRFDIYCQTHENELHGMISVCTKIGLYVDIHWGYEESKGAK